MSAATFRRLGCTGACPPAAHCTVGRHHCGRTDARLLPGGWRCAVHNPTRGVTRRDP